MMDLIRFNVEIFLRQLIFIVVLKDETQSYLVLCEAILVDSLPASRQAV